jgi:orotate phosphoribosyltransferase
VGRTPTPEERVLVIDDVFTTGATKLEALELIEASSGVRALGIVVTVDRRKRGQESGLGSIALTSVVALADMVAYLERIGDSRAHVVRRFWEE